MDQNDLILKIPCFAIQDQVIHLYFLLVFKSKIGLTTMIQIHTFSDSQIWITSALQRHFIYKKEWFIFDDCANAVYKQ